MRGEYSRIKVYADGTRRRLFYVGNSRIKSQLLRSAKNTKSKKRLQRARKRIGLGN